MGWLLITRPLPRIPAAIAGLILVLQPPLSFTWDVLFVNRATSTMASTGVILARFAIYLGAASGRKVSATSGKSNRLHSTRLCAKMNGSRLTGTTTASRFQAACRGDA
ncbi:hypothetical protein [Desulfosarcina sp.]|uniref:hypothetical protein n=1 Tax=Desulfosarcina sp. TaxID=2027861 RepID=UPI00356AE00F